LGWGACPILYCLKPGGALSFFWGRGVATDSGGQAGGHSAVGQVIPRGVNLLPRQVFRGRSGRHGVAQDAAWRRPRATAAFFPKGRPAVGAIAPPEEFATPWGREPAVPLSG